ncbi:MAG TPA: tRNA uridine-5-carboxymethylaminomethyl(34) synthesis GTPase MnmE [Methylococcaceae bacterium]|nr:tRNA uridine-5-carboxymethylaminomethyl(34) synthesis GTPase MnmE [Methylococcaceae bacterium]HIA45915.1 tRNA uridine-5-carboxymethylaminomethyl(34) synthesis GTPase MnmE [Methylococcaceae bacterium]HIN68170.1 tRNA uridine-5-carboxymethylaminomethyl(34) synthesis GTPase MnmE [Methylococcales bacterium]HIO45360.1 tRNA uridine-5-carboxymethylaminomethyl(34) synthesis GTPase MnmE [Methylococcales bacterium]
MFEDTIAAIATPFGKGGVAIIRISGPHGFDIAQQLSSRKPQDRKALFTSFYDASNNIIDSGICIYFKAPNSYTGEDVVEIQGHGGIVVINMLLKRIISLGARIAKPGEFTERAFLNNKLDLTQAEAVADIIESTTEHAVKSAQRSLQGTFSKLIHELVGELTELRIYVEAAIDFVDEEIDFLNEGGIEQRIKLLSEKISLVLSNAKTGQLLRDGISVVLVGKPNAGKSSLLNSLTGEETAIVTDIAGTTRDVLKEYIQLDGLPLHIIDTAGIHDSDNLIEQEGIRRAHQEIQRADKVLIIHDVRDQQGINEFVSQLDQNNDNRVIIFNKIDLINEHAKVVYSKDGDQIFLSIKTGEGFDLLTDYLKKSVGYDENQEAVFIARQRHVNALTEALTAINNSLIQLQQNQAGELVAEELRLAQNHLGEITGKISSDDLLGKIFSNFCIGK